MRHWRRGAAGALWFLAALVGLGVWAVSSPLGSDPDGSFHLNSIWCGQGIREGLCENPPPEQADTKPKTIMTPLALSSAGQCFAFRSLDSAACQDAIEKSRDLVPNQFNNQGRLYPNTYYWVASHLVGDNIMRSAILVRVMNVLALLVLLVLLRQVARPEVFRAVVLSLIVVWIPFGLFLVASNNGSSWTLTGVGLFWAFLLTVFESDKWKNIALACLGALACAVMATGSRVDGAIYIGLTAVVVVFISWNTARNLKLRLFGLATTALVGLLSLSTYLSSRQSGSLISGLNRGNTFGRSTIDVVWTNLFRLPGFFLGVYGIGGFGSGLGWLDTPMESLTWMLMLAALVGLLFRSNWRFHWRTWLGIGGLVAAALAIPTYMFVLDGAIVGENIQSRYIVPLVTVIVGMFGLQTLRTNNPWSLTSASRAVLATFITVAHAAALHINMRRYISGLDVWSPNLNKAREWWPIWLPSPNICWVAGSTAVGVVTFFMFFREIPGKETVETETEN
jgi:hypothetical protein